MFCTDDSKSKSKPFTTAEPNGRGAVLPLWTGPNIAHTFCAADTAAADELNPPSV
jgi:hypothetical protein